jgi:serine/threonine protein phosphatase PrpC
MKTDTHLGIYTDKGGRPYNEDAYLAVPLPDRPSGLVFLGGVADGVGGQVAGRAASAYAVKVLQEFFLRRSNQLTTKNLPELLRQIFYRINANIHQKGTSSEKYAGMGTTLTCLLASPTNVTIAHVGDTRAYIKRGNRIFQITRDHLMEDAAAAEEIDERFALFEEEPMMIGRALGVEPDVEVDIYRLDVEEGDTFLLVSDGIYQYLDEKEMSGTIDSLGSSDEAARELAEAAVAKGATDNVTAVIWEAKGLETVVAQEAVTASVAEAPAPEREMPAAPTADPSTSEAEVVKGRYAVSYSSLFDAGSSVSSSIDELERLMDVALEHELLQTQHEMESHTEVPPVVAEAPAEAVEAIVEEPEEPEEPEEETILQAAPVMPPPPPPPPPAFEQPRQEVFAAVPPPLSPEPPASAYTVTMPEPAAPAPSTTVTQAPQAPAAFSVAPEPPPGYTRSRGGKKALAIAACVIALLVVSGALIYMLVIDQKQGSTIKTETVTPSLAGMSLIDAQSALENKGLKCGDVKEENNPGVEKGMVISTTPSAGEPCNGEGTVIILVSLGPAATTRTVALPNVMGLSQEEAIAALQGAGFNVTNLVESNNEEVQPGCICGQDPAPDGFYPEGTEVALVISIGPSGPQWITCTTCGGSGKITCSACGGRGTVTSSKACSACGGSGVTSTGFTCSACGGSGRVTSSSTCSKCGGAGKATCSTCGGKGRIQQ